MYSLTLLLTSSCALTQGRNIVSDNTVKIERVASKRAVVTDRFGTIHFWFYKETTLCWPGCYTWSHRHRVRRS